MHECIEIHECILLAHSVWQLTQCMNDLVIDWKVYFENDIMLGMKFYYSILNSKRINILTAIGFATGLCNEISTILNVLVSSLTCCDLMMRG